MIQITFAAWMISQCEASFDSLCADLRQISDRDEEPYAYEEEDHAAETLYHERGLITTMWEDGVNGYA